MKPIYYIFPFLLVGLALLFGSASLTNLESQQIEPNIVVEVNEPTEFQRATGVRNWKFPEDFGPHPNYQTEWWYYTGNLETEAGQRFGYQLTFFRRALLPEQDRIERQSTWAVEQIYMAHFAISNIDSEEHYAFERFARGAAGLAGAQVEPYQLWLENWQVVQTAEGQYQLTAKQEEIALELILKDLKGPIFHGDQGYSQKGKQKGNASYYYSQTRLETSGNVRIKENNYVVRGLSWKDHEFSTSALSPGQVGWDWFSFQLEDGSELMVFQIRREDGSIDPFSSGTWISPEGETKRLEQEEFIIQVRDNWRSVNSEAEYPSEWNIKIPSLSLDLEVKPYMFDQEMNVSYTYWEGAVEVDGTLRGGPISGSGYVEMTGYAESMEGLF
jgi:predicted secreted hydrolase